MKKTNKNKKRIPPLKWKLFSFFAAFAAAILLLLWILQIWHLDDFYVAITKRNLIRSGTELAAASSEELQATADSIALDNEICVLIFDNSGKKLASSDPSGGCIIHKLGNDNLNELYANSMESGKHVFTTMELTRLPNGSGSVFEREPRTDAEASEEKTDAPLPGSTPVGKNFNLSRIVYSSVVKTDSGIRFILLDCPLTPVGAVVSTLMVQLSTVSVIAAITALAAAFVLSRFLSKPVTGLSKSAARLANGEYDTVFKGGEWKEIDELSDALNYAAGELSKVDRMQKELIANVSHDLRTPLTMISGYAEVMRDIPGENSPENVQVILDETARLTALVNDIIDLSRLQLGKRTLDMQTFSLTDAIRETAERFKKLNECKGYTIACNADKEIFVCADRTAIIQVLYNLIGNGITYTGEDKTVYVSLTHTDGSALVEIRDTGKGIEEGEIEHIWERYYRSEENHARGVGGSGIGLSIVKELLEAHGASYGVTSTKGVGSVFYFSLPTVE